MTMTKEQEKNERKKDDKRQTMCQQREREREREGGGRDWDLNFNTFADVMSMAKINLLDKFITFFCHQLQCTLQFQFQIVVVLCCELEVNLLWRPAIC